MASDIPLPLAMAPLLASQTKEKEEKEEEEDYNSSVWGSHGIERQGKEKEQFIQKLKV